MDRKQKQFESWLSETVGVYRYSETRKNGFLIMTYKVTGPLQPRFHSLVIIVCDGGMCGYTASYKRDIRKTWKNAEGLYHLQDVYDLLKIALTDPEKVCFRENSSSEILPAETLKKQPCDFTWQPRDGLSRFDKNTLLNALELVKYGIVSDLYLEDNKAKTVSRVPVCYRTEDYAAILRDLEEGSFQEDSWEADSMGNHSVTWERDGQVHTGCTGEYCQKPKCLLALCGYLEYCYRNGTLKARLLDWIAALTRSEPFAFKWVPEDGLRRIEESQFRFAVRLVDNGYIRLDTALNKDGQIVIRPNFSICAGINGKDMADETVCSLSSKLRMNDSSSRGTLLPYPLGTLSRSIVFDECKNCIMKNTCPYFCAGYISYLRICGKEDQIHKDREWHRAHLCEAEEKTVSPFQFSDVPEDCFLEMPEQIFNAGELLQAEGYVSMRRQKAKTNDASARPCWRIDYVQALKETRYLDPAVLTAEIQSGKLDRTFSGNWYQIVDFHGDISHLNQSIVAAGYIDYLRKIGHYGKYKEARLTRLSEIKKAFNGYLKRLPELQNVLDAVKNPTENGLYCIIEGNRGTDKEKLAETIAQMLAIEGKIDSAKVQPLSFDQLAKDRRKRVYDPSCSYENSHVSFKELERRKLYVLSELDEFLFMAQGARQGDASAVTHLIDLLGRYESAVYIVVLADPKSVESFLNLSPQIRFLFGKNRIPVGNLSADQFYEAYRGYLSPMLQEQAGTLAFRLRLLDYMTLNEKLLPLKNRELADYLADYANNRQELVLPPDVKSRKTAEEMLASVIGMENIKESVCDFESYAKFQKNAETAGIHLPDSNLHMVFTGNPGTGKTMIARVIAKILFDLGIVEEDKLVEVERKDLVAAYLGQTAIKTADVIKKAIGGVLFIDEAYALSSDFYGKEAVATLIKAMEDRKDELVVIFAGYEKEMHEFLNCNSGIASRIGYTFRFQDYSTEELVQIFDIKMQKAGFVYGEEVRTRIAEICEQSRKQKDFGNGRFVDKLMQRVLVARSKRSDDDPRIILPGDVPALTAIASTDVTEPQDYEEELGRLIGLESIKQQIRKLARYMRFQQNAKKAGATIPEGSMHMIFTGNPGTGKTMVARIMVNMLYDIGAIHERKLVEAERKDLIGRYIGETAPLTAAVIERAMGGVLFIDEAYTLTPHDPRDFGREAIATLIKAMEDHKDKLIVIFAGYREEMREFIDSNPGIASRIGYQFDFEDYSPEELCRMFRLKAVRSGFQVDGAAMNRVLMVCTRFARRKNFGNGRFIDRLFQETLVKHSGLIETNPEDLLRIREQDIPTPEELSQSG